MIIGVQLFGSTSSSAQRFDSSHAVSEGDASDKAEDWATHLAPAGYVLPGYYGTATETTMAAEWGTATAARKIEIEDEYIVYELDASQSQAFDDGITGRFDAWCTEAATRGLAVTQYEGSLETNAAGTGGDVGGLRNAAKYSDETYGLARTHYTYYFSKGIEFPSAYGLFGESPWSLFNPNVYSTLSPEYLGIISFNPGAPEPEPTPTPPSGGGGAGGKGKGKPPKRGVTTYSKEQLEEEENRRQRLKKNELALEDTIRLAHQRLSGKVTEPAILEEEPTPHKLAIHAEKLAEALAEKSKDSAKLRTRNKAIIADLQRQAQAIMQEEEEAIIMLLH